MKITRTIAGMTLALSLTGFIGCGGSGSSKSSGTTGSPDSKTTSTGNSPSSGVTSSSTRRPSSEPVDVCKKITAEEVSSVIGGVVSAEEIPGGGCRFPQEDLRAPTASFDSTSITATNGGYEAGKFAVTSTINGESKDLPGVGDKAFFVIGTSPGGAMPQGGGLVEVGPTVIQVTMIEGSGMTDDAVEALTKKLLEFAASKA